MNEELRTYILDNMDEGTVIDFPRKEKGRILSKAKKLELDTEDIQDDECEQYDEMLFGRPVECLGIVSEDALFDEECDKKQFKEENTFIADMRLDDYINDHLKEHSSFQNLLFKLIDDRGLSDPEVYNKALVSRKTFSKIRTDANYHPSKETVILFGLSLELSIKEMEELLASASYALTRCDVSDLIVRFALHKEIYNVFEINEMLDEYNCKPLGVN